MAFEIVTVAGSIAALTIPGVNVDDLGQVADAVEARRCPLLRPFPQAGIELSSLTDASFGSTSAKKDLTYSITYAFFYGPVGDERGLEQIMPGLWAGLSRVLTVLRDNDTLAGCADIRPAKVSQAGPIADPAGNQFHGALITLTVLEHAD